MRKRNLALLGRARSPARVVEDGEERGELSKCQYEANACRDDQRPDFELAQAGDGEQGEEAGDDAEIADDLPGILATGQVRAETVASGSGTTRPNNDAGGSDPWPTAFMGIAAPARADWVCISKRRQKLDGG